MSYDNMSNCLYNMIYIKFNEDMGKKNNVYYNLQFPSFYKFKNSMFKVSSELINSLNANIRDDISTFRAGIIDGSVENNNAYYKIISDFAVPFNKNSVLSVILSLMAFDDDGVDYNELYNYNYDLTTGNKLLLKDVFISGVDYMKIVNDYIKYKINQSKDSFYHDISIDISENQAFYITDDAVVIYFGVDEIAPSRFGIPKFKMEYKKFAPYINPRFYCMPMNVSRKFTR